MNRHVGVAGLIDFHSPQISTLEGISLSVNLSFLKVRCGFMSTDTGCDPVQKIQFTDDCITLGITVFWFLAHYEHSVFHLPYSVHVTNRDTPIEHTLTFNGHNCQIIVHL